MSTTCVDCGGRLIPGNAPYTSECEDCGIVYAAPGPHTGTNATKRLAWPSTMNDGLLYLAVRDAIEAALLRNELPINDSRKRRKAKRTG